MINSKTQSFIKTKAYDKFSSQKIRKTIKIASFKTVKPFTIDNWNISRKRQFPLTKKAISLA